MSLGLSLELGVFMTEQKLALVFVFLVHAPDVNLEELSLSQTVSLKMRLEFQCLQKGIFIFIHTYIQTYIMSLTTLPDKCVFSI